MDRKKAAKNLVKLYYDACNYFMDIMMLQPSCQYELEKIDRKEKGVKSVVDLKNVLTGAFEVGYLKAKELYGNQGVVTKMAKSMIALPTKAIKVAEKCYKESFEGKMDHKTLMKKLYNIGDACFGKCRQICKEIIQRDCIFGDEIVGEDGIIERSEESDSFFNALL